MQAGREARGNVLAGLPKACQEARRRVASHLAMTGGKAASRRRRATSEWSDVRFTARDERAPQTSRGGDGFVASGEIPLMQS